MVFKSHMLSDEQFKIQIYSVLYHVYIWEAATNSLKKMTATLQLAVEVNAVIVSRSTPSSANDLFFVLFATVPSHFHFPPLLSYAQHLYPPPGTTLWATYRAIYPSSSCSFALPLRFTPDISRSFFWLIILNAADPHCCDLRMPFLSVTTFSLFFCLFLFLLPKVIVFYSPVIFTPVFLWDFNYSISSCPPIQPGLSLYAVKFHNPVLPCFILFLLPFPFCDKIHMHDGVFGCGRDFSQPSSPFTLPVEADKAQIGTVLIGLIAALDFLLHHTQTQMSSCFHECVFTVLKSFSKV